MGATLLEPPPAKTLAHTIAPVSASKAVTCPCSPRVKIRSCTPFGVLTFVNNTGAPSELSAAGRGTLNNGVSLATLPTLIAVSDVLLAALSGVNPNCSQSALEGAAASSWKARIDKGNCAKNISASTTMMASQYLRPLILESS